MPRSTKPPETKTWDVRIRDRWFVVNSADLRFEAMGSNTVATFLDDAGLPVAVFNNPDSVVAKTE